MFVGLGEGGVLALSVEEGGVGGGEQEEGLAPAACRTVIWAGEGGWGDTKGSCASMGYHACRLHML